MFAFKVILNQKSKKVIKNFDNYSKKKIFKKAKLFIQAGNAKAVPPISSILGQFGINLLEFCERFNTRTKHLSSDLLLPVLVTVFNNKTFNFSVKTILLTDLLYAFSVEEHLIFYLQDLASIEKSNNLIVTFYKSFVVLLFLYNQNILKLGYCKLYCSFGILNYLNQFFGYTSSFYKFKNLIK